jgi:hypothetical protein
LSSGLDTSKFVVGSIFVDAVGKRLAFCPLLSKVLFSRESSPSIFHSWNKCSVDGKHCTSRGRRLKFSSYGIDSLCVVWICPKVAGLPLGSV